MPGAEGTGRPRILPRLPRVHPCMSSFHHAALATQSLLTTTEILTNMRRDRYYSRLSQHTLSTMIMLFLIALMGQSGQV